MRITYVNFSPIPSCQANSVNSIMTCQSLAALGHNVEVLVPGFSTARKLSHGGMALGEFYGLNPKFEFRYVPFARLIQLGRWGRHLFSRLVIHMSRKPELFYTRRLEIAIQAGVQGYRAIFEAHNFSKTDPRLLRDWVDLFKKTPRTVALVCTTNASAKEFVSAGIPVERTRVIPNGVDYAKYADANSEGVREFYDISNEKALVTYCGTMGKSKGVGYVLEAAQLLPEMQFLLIGGRPDKLERCRQIADSMNLTNVIFTGFISHGEVPDHLCASDYLVFTLTRIPGYPHKYCSPMKMFEYMASGRASVVTRFGTVNEVLQDGRNAILVEPDNADALAAGLRRLAEDKELALRIGCQAREDAARYDWGERGKRIVEFVWEMFP